MRNRAAQLARVHAVIAAGFASIAHQRVAQFQGRRIKKPVPPIVTARPGGPDWVPPLPSSRGRLSTQHTPWEEFERWRIRGRATAYVPPSVLITTGADNAWRRMEVP